MLFKSPHKKGTAFLGEGIQSQPWQNWLNSFRNCFNLKNVQTTNEAKSADEEAAKIYPNN